MLKEVEAILDERVRPSLRAHSGDIEVLSLENGVLRFRFLGRCSGCPSASLTTEQLVEAEVTAALPAVRQAVMVQEVSDGLMAQARALMRHG